MNPNNRLKEIIFSKSCITNESFPILVKILESKRIPKLKFIDAIDQSYYIDFFNEMTKINIINGIETISFEDQNCLPADIAMSTFSRSKNFEFINCNTEVDSILQFFKKDYIIMLLKSIFTTMELLEEHIVLLHSLF